MGTEVKDGRIRVTNAAGEEVFNTDHDHAFFIREVETSFVLPFRQDIDNVGDSIPDSHFLLVDDLPAEVAWVQAMVRNNSPNFTTNWLCFGASILLEYQHDASPRKLAVASLRLEPPNLYVDVSYDLHPGYSVPSSTVEIYLIFGGFN